MGYMSATTRYKKSYRSPSRSKKHFLYTVLLPAIIVTYLLFTLLRYLTTPHYQRWDTTFPAPPLDIISTRVFSTPNTIPKKLWYKLNPQGLTSAHQTWMQTCISQNPTYETTILTDVQSDAYIRTHFTLRPDIIALYTDIRIPILKADILRYLILYASGGIFLDVDTSCAPDAPFDAWVPESSESSNINLVVGWEFDIGWVSFQRQFATWTLMASPGSPHIARVIDNVIESIRLRMIQYNVTIDALTYDMIAKHEGILDFSGARKMTRVLIESMSQMLDRTVDVSDEAEGMVKLVNPVQVGDVLILPAYAFAWSANRYVLGERQGPRLVEHHYAGTWMAGDREGDGEDL